MNARIYAVGDELDLSAEYLAMERMFAYGQPHAQLWCVGLEEHCDDEDLPRRIELRRHLGEYISLRDFHLALYGRVPTNVRVWDLTLRLYERIFSRTTLVGEISPANSDILLTEILPLPRPTHDKWPAVYHHWWPDGPKTYVAYARPRMARRLIDRVATYKPAVVLLHGKTQHRQWIHSLGGVEWTAVSLGRRRNETGAVAFRKGTVWALTNNLVGNGFVSWNAEQIDALSTQLRAMMLGS
jgi:hypothetical protein